MSSATPRVSSVLPVLSLRFQTIFLGSELGDGLVDCVFRFLGWISRRQNVKRQTKSINKKPRVSRRPFAGHKSHTLFKMDQHYLHLVLIGAIIWAIYQAKIIERNGTVESTSSQRLMSNVWLHVMQTRRAALSRLRKESGAHAEHIPR